MTLLRGPRSERLVALSFVGFAVVSAAWLLALVEGVERTRVVRATQLSRFGALRAAVGVRACPTPGPIRELDGLFGSHSVSWVHTDSGFVLELRPGSPSEARE